MMDEKEKWDRRFSLILTGGINILLFIALFFIVAWREPNPPIPEYGIELNLGIETEGFGEEQPTEPMQQGESQIQPSEPTPESAESPTQPQETPPVEQQAITPKEETAPALEKEIKKPTPKPPAKPVEKNDKETEKKTAVESKILGIEEGKKGGTTQGQGNNLDKLGDAGKSEGKIDANALYGGSGGGFSLSMSGWAWASNPNIPDLNENQNGRVVFYIECDEAGEIIKIQIRENTLSAKSTQLLQAEIEKNSLIRTSEGAIPERSSGVVAFEIRAQ